MRPSSEIGERVNRYLLEVATHLESRSPAERRELLEDLEAHLYEALRRRAGGEPTLADLETVLAGMDPPQSYARPPDAEGDVVAAPPQRARLSLGRWALGSLLAGIVLLALLAAMAGMADRENQDDVYAVAGMVFFALETIALVLGILSWREPAGKVVVIVYCALLVLVVLFVLWNYPGAYQEAETDSHALPSGPIKQQSAGDAGWAPVPAPTKPAER
jgi:hypothetical protein